METLRWALEAFVAGRQNNALQLRLVQTERLRTLGQVSAAVPYMILNQLVMAVSMSAEQLNELSKIAPTLSRLGQGMEGEADRRGASDALRSRRRAPPPARPISRVSCAQFMADPDEAKCASSSATTRRR